MFTNIDFQNYRKQLGFSNQTTFKNFLKGKDIEPIVDFEYIDALNKRLEVMFRTFNQVYCFQHTEEHLEVFLNDSLMQVYSNLVQNQIFAKLNNQGRRREEVYFSWMRGHLVGEFFKDFIASIWEVDKQEIYKIGDDDFSCLETFKRSPKADFALNNGFCLEIQSGFQNINDIKEHKVREAKKKFYDSGNKTFAIHFDLFNGQVACVNLSEIQDDDINWITRQQMEGQTVFNINQSFFHWHITEKPTLKISQLNLI